MNMLNEVKKKVGKLNPLKKPEAAPPEKATKGKKKDKKQKPKQEKKEEITVFAKK